MPLNPSALIAHGTSVAFYAGNSCGARMSEHKSKQPPDNRNEADKPGSAARRPEVGDTSKRAGGQTGAGQEARRGVPPGEHADEHQSNYGGGGANGGANGGTTNDRAANDGTAGDDRA
jgi:hypothetical protein